MTASLAGCGTSSEIVAQVGRVSITRATLEHWTKAEGILTTQLYPTQRLPAGVSPDPPRYKNCIAYLAGIALQQGEDPSVITPTGLRARCRQRYEMLQRHMLDILITARWLDEEAAANGVTATKAEIDTLVTGKFPTKAALHKYLAFTDQSEADLRLVLKRVILSEKLKAYASRGQDLPPIEQEKAWVNFGLAMTKRWKARTNCHPGYIVSECRQYTGTESPF